MDVKARKTTLRMLTNGMYVITSRNGDRYGAATVTWVSQASFRPTLIMAAVRPDSNVFKCMTESRVAALHILGRDQVDIAQKFFAPTRVEAGTINGEPFTDGATLVPVLLNAPAYLECRVHRIVDNGGDHAVVIMEAVEAEWRHPVQPLTIADSPWEYGG